MNGFSLSMGFAGGTATQTFDTGNAAMGFVVAAGIVLVFGLIGYIVYSIAVSRIAYNEGHDKPWLAWVPIVNTLMIPMLVEDDVSESLQGRFTLIYVASLVICIPLAMLVPVIGTLIGFIPTILFYYAFYHLANRYSNRPGLHMVLVVVLGAMLLPYQLFRWRNRESL